MAKRPRIRAASQPVQTRLAPPVVFNDFWLWLSLIAASALAYFPAIGGGLLWDDDGHVTRPELQSWQGLWRIWTDVRATQQYYPLLHSTFWIEHSLWGDSVVGYHLVNIVLHATSAFLVILILRRLRVAGATLAGLIFAFHPVCVEAVAWISEQKSTLSGVFYLAAAAVYLRFDESRQRSRYLLALGLFVLALLSKTVTASLPAALLVILWYVRGRLEWRKDCLPLLPFFAVGGTAGLFTAWVEKHYIGAQGPAWDLSLLQRFLLSGRVVWFYFLKVLLPVDLTFTYPRWDIDAGVWWQYLLPASVLTVATLLALLARRNRGPLAALLFFVGTLAPVLGFLNVFPFLYSYVADHFQYIACLGVIVPVAAGLTKLATRFVPAEWGRLAAGCALILVLGTKTSLQSEMYRDNETLFSETIVRNPSSWMAHNNLGNIYSKQTGRRDLAIAEYRAALRLKADHAEAHYNLANLLLATSPDEAIAEYRAGARAKPDMAEIHANLATALSRNPATLSEAIAEYRTAIRLKPDVAVIHLNLANALAAIPAHADEAIAEYREASALDPARPEIHQNLGILLARLPGRTSEAISEYQTALRLKPDFVEARISLGSMYSRLPGRNADAIREYEAALQMNPNAAAAHFNLGLALASIPDRKADAISHLQAAVQLRPDMQQARQLLVQLGAK